MPHDHDFFAILPFSLTHPTFPSKKFDGITSVVEFKGVEFLNYRQLLYFNLLLIYFVFKTGFFE
jgi:hypothetical protein